MPYLIEKSDGTRLPMNLTPEEAAFKAQSFRVFETDADGVVVGEVGAVDGHPAIVDEPPAPGAQAEDGEQQADAAPAEAPAPAAKPARKSAKKSA